MIWSAIEALGVQIIGFALLLLLGLYLDPEDFGIFAIASSIVTFGQIIMDSGLSAALIQRRDITEGHLSVVFMVNLLTGLLVTLLVAGFALCADAIGDGVAWSDLLLLLSANCLFVGLNLAQEAHARRKLRFKALALRRLGSALFGALAAWYCAARGLGAYSLVAQVLGASVLGTILLWGVAPWRPTNLMAAWGSLSDLKSFVRPMLQYSMIKACCIYFPIWILGAMLTHTELGYYNYVSRFAVTGVSAIAAGLSSYLFATLSRLQDSPAEYSAAYWRITSVSFAASAFLALGCYCILPSFIANTLPPEWQEAGRIAQLLPWAGLAACIISPAGSLMLSANRPAWMRNWSLFYLLLLCGGATVAGLLGTGLAAAGAVVVANLIGVGYNLEVTHRILLQPRRGLLARLAGFGAATGVAAGVWWLWSRRGHALGSDAVFFSFVVVPIFVACALYWIPAVRTELGGFIRAATLRMKTPTS